MQPGFVPDPPLNAYPNRCRILVEGQMLDTGTAIEDELTRDPLPLRDDLTCWSGEGSVTY